MVKKLALLFMFVASTVVGQFFVAFSDVNAISQSSLNLDNQIGTYKMYYALGVCAKKSYSNDVISGSDVVAGNWFGKNRSVDVGSIIDKGGDDGSVHCNDIAKIAIKLWKINDAAKFLEQAGWTKADGQCLRREQGQCIKYGPSGYTPTHNDEGIKMQAAIRKQLGGSPSYPSYFGYYDTYETYTGICGGTAVHKGALTANDKTLGYKSIYVADPNKKTATQYVVSVPTKTVHFGPAPTLESTFGDAVKPENYTYDGKSVSCAKVVSALTKNNASQFNKTLPTSLRKSTKLTPPNASGQGDSGSSNDASSCTVEGIGWIVCPVMNFMGHVVDATYSIVSDMLKVPPLSTKSSDPLFKAWATMRNFANIAFVIAFMIIIYSQITGAGVTNYGIKKLLPRIIIAAILVNVSYWICAIAVDLSNVVGSSVKDLFDNITNGLAPTSKDQTWWSSGAKSGGGQVAWTVGIAGVLALGTTALFGSLAILLPLLIGALVAVITVMIVLTARQAILILLIVIAPLAFVAFLLPNTDKWFKRWRETFFAMLFMFPIIAAIFGASKLAGVIIMNSGSNAVIQIMGAGVTIIPLIISPIVMKASTGILGKIGGFVNNPNKGPFDRMKKGAQGYADYRKDVNREKRVGRGANILKGTGKGLGGSNSRRRQALAYLGSGGANRAVDTERKRALAKGIADEKSQEYFAERALSDEGFAARIGGSDKKAEAVKASAQGAVDKIMQQDVANRKILYDADINIRNDPSKVLQDALKDGDEVGIRAAGSMYMEQGGSGFDKLREIVSQHQDTNPTDVKSVDAYRKFVADNGRDFIAKDANEIKWARGAYDEKDAQGNTTRRATLSEAAAAAGDIGRSDTQVAGLTKGSMLRGAQSGSISADQAKTILSNPQTAKEVDQDKQEILRAIIASGGPIQAQSNDELKAAVSNFARSAPTVADLQKAFTQSQPQPSTQPQTIEVVQGSGGGSTTAPQTDVQRNREAGGNFDGPR